MMNWTRSRWLPAAAVTLLLCIAAAAPAPQVAGPAPRPQLQPPCDEFASAVAGDSSIGILNGEGLEQAFPAGLSVSSCSLRVFARCDGRGTIELREWDPTT